MSYTLRIIGLEPVRAMLGQDFGPAMRSATDAIAKEVENVIAPAPGPVHRPIVWASQKQRRFVMALRKGLGPYVRESDPMSQRMQARESDQSGWTIGRRGLGSVLANRASYSAFVHSDKLQQPMHKATGWVTDKQAVQEVIQSGVVARIMLQAIMARLRRR